MIMYIYSHLVLKFYTFSPSVVFKKDVMNHPYSKRYTARPVKQGYSLFHVIEILAREAVHRIPIIDNNNKVRISSESCIDFLLFLLSLVILTSPLSLFSLSLSLSLSSFSVLSLSLLFLTPLSLSSFSLLSLSSFLKFGRAQPICLYVYK